MARKDTEIYDALIAEKNAQVSLNGLQPSVDNAQQLLSDVQSPSRVADWRLWLWLYAVASATLENLWDLFKVELDAKINSAPVGTTRWYQKESFAFQYGDTLVYLNDRYQYATENLLLQIIKRAAVAENGGQVVIKVAKLVGTVVTKLSVGELASFQAYISKIQVAGSQIVIITDDPDLLKIAYTVYYDPLVIAADGSLISNPAVYPAVDAINACISSLEFNGDLILTKLTDAIQLAEGIADPVMTFAAAKFGSNPYVNITVKYNAYAGYMIIDPAFPLSTQLTYLPNV